MDGILKLCPELHRLVSVYRTKMASVTLTLTPRLGLALPSAISPPQDIVALVIRNKHDLYIAVLTNDMWTELE